MRAASVLREGEPSSALTRAADEYLGYLAIERGSSGNTVESYGRDLRRYLAFLADRGIVLPEDVTREVIEEHVRALDEVGLAPASIARGVRYLLPSSCAWSGCWPGPAIARRMSVSLSMFWRR